MSKKAKQWYGLTEEQLSRLVGQGTYPEANSALEHAKKIKEAGHTPAIFYSEFNGFAVLDENDPEQFQRSLSLGNRAKRFRL